MSLTLRFLPQFLQKLFLHRVGVSRPDPNIPFILLLRPYRSERLYFFSACWCAAALYQFGQPVMPTEINSAFWKRSRGFKLPGQAAWKRSLWGFDRVLTADTWSSEIAEIASDSSLIVMDITEITPSILEEFIIVKARQKSEHLICIRNKQSQEYTVNYVSLFAKMNDISISEAIRTAIPYSLDSSGELLRFWDDLAKRCSAILGCEFTEIPHPKPPKGILTNPNAVLSAMRMADYH